MKVDSGRFKAYGRVSSSQKGQILLASSPFSVPSKTLDELSVYPVTQADLFPHVRPLPLVHLTIRHALNSILSVRLNA